MIKIPKQDLLKIFKKYLIWLLLIPILFFIGDLVNLESVRSVKNFFNFSQRTLERNMKARMNAILNGITLKPNSSVSPESEQTAICLWYADLAVIPDMQDFNRASDEFDRWRREGNIYPYIQDYTIDKVEILKDTPTPTAIVSGTINGAEFSVRIPKGDEITWEFKPLLAPVGPVQELGDDI